jgi:RNA polymerase sigma-70 factor (ECF subfamily)
MHEESAFIDLYRTWWGVVCDAAEEVLASRHDAEDAAQRVFMRLWEHGTWWTIHHPRRYFYEAGRREALSSQRHRHPVPLRPLKETETPVLADPAPLPDHGLLQAERRKLAADLIGRLPRRCQEVCALVFLTGMGHREVAERLGITEKAVEKQVARGRRILRKVVGFEEWPRVSTFGDGGGEGFFASIG